MSNQKNILGAVDKEIEYLENKFSLRGAKEEKTEKIVHYWSYLQGRIDGLMWVKKGLSVVPDSIKGDEK